MYWANRSLSEPWFTASAVAYSLLILVTFLGNSLVIWAVARRKELWSPRNIFILNLAVSDICKCPSAAPSPLTWFYCLSICIQMDLSLSLPLELAYEPYAYVEEVVRIPPSKKDKASTERRIIL